MKKIFSFAREIQITGKYNMEMVENSRLLICGCVGIAGYSCESVRICTRADDIIICGCGITLCFAGEGKLMIEGCIRSIHFEKGGAK